MTDAPEFGSHDQPALTTERLRFFYSDLHFTKQQLSELGRWSLPEIDLALKQTGVRRSSETYTKLWPDELEAIGRSLGIIDFEARPFDYSRIFVQRTALRNRILGYARRWLLDWEKVDKTIGALPTIVK